MQKSVAETPTADRHRSDSRSVIYIKPLMDAFDRAPAPSITEPLAVLDHFMNWVLAGTQSEWCV